MEQKTEPIDPNDLLVFALVVELGSLSRAADHLGWPKSRVSRRLALLEGRIGERLLLRTTRRQTITEMGAQLLEHARQVKTETEAVAALREHRQTTPSGRLRVSMSSDVASLLLADALAAFVSMHPAIHLEVDLSSRRVDVIGERFDLALRVGDLPDDATLAARRLCELSSGLYAAPAYLQLHGEPQHPQDLMHHQTVRLQNANGEVPPWSLRRGDAHWQGTPPAQLTANLPAWLIRMAVSGVGIVAAPEAYAVKAVQTGRLRRVLADWCLPTRTLSAVFPGRQLMPVKTRVFLDMLTASLGSGASVQ